MDPPSPTRTTPEVSSIDTVGSPLQNNSVTTTVSSSVAAIGSFTIGSGTTPFVPIPPTSASTQSFTFSSVASSSLPSFSAPATIENPPIAPPIPPIAQSQTNSYFYISARCYGKGDEIYWMDEEEKLCGFNLKSLGELEGDDFDYHSSCNGLLCYSRASSTQAFIINPLKEEVLFLRQPPSPSSHHVLRIVKSSFGLGVCGESGNETFKILLLQCAKHVNLASILTLGSDAWRVIRYPSVANVDDLDILGDPVFEKGFIYWYAPPEDIIVFDVEREIFSITKVPIDTNCNICWDVDLRILCLGDRVGFIRIHCGVLEIWYGKNHNSEGKITEWEAYDPIQIFHEGELFDFFLPIQVLGAWKDESSMLVCSWSSPRVFFCYNFVTKTATMVNIPNRPENFVSHSFRGSSLLLTEFHGSSELVYLPPERNYNTSRSGLIRRGIEDIGRT
uniref:F-box associated beta-propeller type 1 domain-containing protein n=1 Tax=Cannabis sativa TaxID=3483 RepID=A0A803R7K7_CANSA